MLSFFTWRRVPPVCDGWSSSFFSSPLLTKNLVPPPFAYVKKNLVPPLPVRKYSGPLDMRAIPFEILRGAHGKILPTPLHILACPGIRQNAPISALIKPICLCGTQNVQKKIRTRPTIFDLTLPCRSYDGRCTI